LLFFLEKEEVGKRKLRKRRSELYIFDCNNSFKEILVFCCMFKIGIRYFFERLMINYFNKRSENLEEHDVYWKVTSFYNKKPDYGLKIGLFGKVEMFPKHGHSRLEEASKDDIKSLLKNSEKIKDCTEDRENDRMPPTQ